MKKIIFIMTMISFYSGHCYAQTPSCANPYALDLSAISDSNPDHTNMDAGIVLLSSNLIQDSGYNNTPRGRSNGDLTIGKNLGSVEEIELNFNAPVQLILSQPISGGPWFDEFEVWTLTATGGTLTAYDPGSEHSYVGGSPGNPQPELTNISGNGTSVLNFTPTAIFDIPAPDSNWSIISTPLTGIKLHFDNSAKNTNGTQINFAICATDHGDGNGLSDASHWVQPDFLLGSSIDAEGAAQPSADGDGDDNLGPETDDEDGVSIPSMTPGIPATITANVTGSGGYLQGWIDWNNNGLFTEPGEQIAFDLQDLDADNIISIPVTPPTGLSSTKVFARFRWSNTTGLSSTGNAAVGEVEDYAIILPKQSLAINKVASALGFTTGNIVNAPPGTVVTYTYTIKNDGDVPISGIKLVDSHNGTGAPPIPGNETLLNDLGNPGDSSDGGADGVWDVLAPEDEISFTANYTITQKDVETLQ